MEKDHQEFSIDLEAFEGLVKNPKTDFFNPIPHAKGLDRKG